MLAETHVPHANISTELTVLSFVYTGSDSTVAVARVEIGRGQAATRHNFTTYIKINGAQCLPEQSLVTNETHFNLNSKEFQIVPGDLVNISIIGEITETDVSIDSYLTEPDKTTLESVINDAMIARQIVLPPSTGDVSVDLANMMKYWSAALVADATNPQPTYSVSSPDGTSRTVQRDEWRRELLQNIKVAQQTINMFSPYVITTRQIVR